VVSSLVVFLLFLLNFDFSLENIDVLLDFADLPEFTDSLDCLVLFFVDFVPDFTDIPEFNDSLDLVLFFVEVSPFCDAFSVSSIVFSLLFFDLVSFDSFVFLMDSFDFVVDSLVLLLVMV